MLKSEDFVEITDDRKAVKMIEEYNGKFR